MRALVLALALTACGGPEPRQAIVSPMGGVDLGALETALAGLHEATAGDVALELGTCREGRYCIAIVAIRDYVCPGYEGERCAGHTNYPGAEGVIVHLDDALGNNAGTMAHELMHAIGVGGHVPGEGPELMSEVRPGGATERLFGPGTAALYRDEFGVEVPGCVSFATTPSP